jgi:hypothetical protein
MKNFKVSYLLRLQASEMLLKPRAGVVITPRIVSQVMIWNDDLMISRRSLK